MRVHFFKVPRSQSPRRTVRHRCERSKRGTSQIWCGAGIGDALGYVRWWRQTPVLWRKRAPLLPKVRIHWAGPRHFQKFMGRAMKSWNSVLFHFGRNEAAPRAATSVTGARKTLHFLLIPETDASFSSTLPCYTSYFFTDPLRRTTLGPKGELRTPRPWCSLGWERQTLLFRRGVVSSRGFLRIIAFSSTFRVSLLLLFTDSLSRVAHGPKMSCTYSRSSICFWSMVETGGSFSESWASHRWRAQLHQALAPLRSRNDAQRVRRSLLKLVKCFCCATDVYASTQNGHNIVPMEWEMLQVLYLYVAMIALRWVTGCFFAFVGVPSFSSKHKIIFPCGAWFSTSTMLLYVLTQPI